MNRDRTPWVAIGLLLTSLAGLALAIGSMNGLASPSGDLMASSASGTTNLMIALGAFLLLGLDLLHARLRPSPGRRHTRTGDAARR